MEGCVQRPRLRVKKYRVEHGSNAGYSQNYNKADKTKRFCFENNCYEQSVLLSRDILYKGGGESQNFVAFGNSDSPHPLCKEYL